MTTTGITPNPELDLFFERVIDVPPELVWAAWTQPEHVVEWFTPAPWKTIDCQIDLKPGGTFNTLMQSPEGENFPNEGCFLEVIPNRRLVFTDTLLPGFRPSGKPYMTAIISMEPEGAGTRYTAMAMHANVDDRKSHEARGFREGWGKALDQLIAHM